MRNTLPLLTRAPAPLAVPGTETPPPQQVPSIRLISATPSATGSASDASTSFTSAAPFASSPLAPRTDSQPARKRLVPKKSKLGLLGGAKAKGKENKDFSDVVRRVGGTPSTSRSGFEIYVDQGDDPDLGEIVVVKKKKSRLGLDGMKWGALGEVTNVPSAPKEQKAAAAPVELLKAKGEDSQKWWSIARGRKDSKENRKEKESGKPKPPTRSKTPEPAKSLDSRARFNSLDSGIVLAGFATQERRHADSISSARVLCAGSQPAHDNLPDPEPAAVAANGLLAPNAPPAGSIAIRAMRSMRSMARISSWAQLGANGDKDAGENAKPSTVSKAKTKEKGEKGEGKKKKKKEKTKEKGDEVKDKTVRLSGSSFEAGALSAQDTPAVKAEDTTKTLGKKKHSVLGLGLPSTLRMTTVRNTSSASSTAADRPVMPNRLSVDSAHLIMNASGRPSSVVSNGSSLRPPSTASGISAFSGRSQRSSSSSVVSVRWDEEGIRSSKELQRKERRVRDKDEKSTRTKRESRKSSDSRKRTAISEVFPEAVMERPASMSPPASVFDRPLVVVEEATADGHSDHANSIAETPVKRPRPRPVSEQMLGRVRPQPIRDDGDGIKSILDAATDDLASLINRLDLEATPSSTHNTSPLQPSSLRVTDESPLKRRAISSDSPLKHEVRDSIASISSLRPYAHAQSAMSATIKPSSSVRHLIGQPIAPWSELDWKVSPRKPDPKRTTTTHLRHKRTMTPSPDIDPIPVFQPLRPAKAKAKILPAVVTSSPSVGTPPISNNEGAAPSSATFGSRPSKVGLKLSKGDDDGDPSPTPAFKRGHVRKGSSLVAMKGKESRKSLRRSIDAHGMPISPEGRKGLGLAGTMGGSMSTEPPVDPEDPDSDIPDELQVILSGQSDEECNRCLDDTLCFQRVSSPSPQDSPREQQVLLPESEARLELNPEPVAPTDEGNPVFCAQLFDEEANQADIDEGGNGSSSEDDTKKSFDFTGELQKLNESGGSDRRSFVEQLENAFRTPARIELGYGLGEPLGLNEGFLAPPVPPLPAVLRRTPTEGLVPQNVSDLEYSMQDTSTRGIYQRDSGISEDAQFATDEAAEDECRVYPRSKASGSMRSKASDGQLNVDFKFGGKPVALGSLSEGQEKPLTLSDIIPPVSHARSASTSSVSVEDDSVLKSIMAKAADIQPLVPRAHLESDTSSKRPPQNTCRSAVTHSSHSKTTSEASFVGFESFDEVRRGFEFGPDRPTFYPPPGAVSRQKHGREQSMYSIASISSYGATLDSGAVDPFGFGPSRPVSDASMSMSVDDTFSFIHRQRQRVDSDASSFYFHAPGSNQATHPSRRGHRRHESAMSVASNAPPVSMYNRSFGVHRRSDSSTSASSMAHSYAMHGAHGGRAAWARHRQDPSVDSRYSDYSAHRLGRPGLGDKMFDNEQGMPLTAISASPPESVVGDLPNHRSSWDSAVFQDRMSMGDSFYDNPGDRTSVSSDDSVFGDGPYSYGRQMPPRQYRPISVLSEMSVHSPRKEDDTMITMFDGDHVRRRSVSSLIEASPCVRVEKMSHTRPILPKAVLRFEQDDIIPADSPRLIEKPSIASTSSHQFGGERMIMARKGLLERQSLEDSVLMAQGEDLLASLRSQSVFLRPGPTSRSRSSTCTSSSGGETPPLSSSDGSSLSSGSQSSIDLGHLNSVLANVTQPSGVARARARSRARGTGHRRRISQARASRSSVYETILEEASVLSSSPSSNLPTPSSTKAVYSPAAGDSIFVVDGDGESLMGGWDEEHGISTLRRYYALKDEAHETVTESKRTWTDTPFSVFALQAFHPPNNRGGMQALLEHSQKNYGPLPSELHPHRVRSRTSSRASPYPLRSMRSLSSEVAETHTDVDVNNAFVSSVQSVLREVPVNVNTATNALSPAPALEVIKPFTPFALDFNPSKQGKREMPPFPLLPPLPALGARPRVTSSVRRNALGWSKRSTGKSSSSDQKENISQGMLITPSETLRINRPRPRGRPTPARNAVPAL